jgi:formylglycine-generating enzyme required for sulfatase activity
LRYVILFVLISSNLVGQMALKKDTVKIKGTDVAFVMVPVVGGQYKVGSNEACDVGIEKDEMPQRIVNISTFWMGAHEVTYDEYQLFFEEEKDPKPKMLDGITRPSPPYIDFTLGMGKVGGYPANSMQQYAALMYCKWLYKRTGIFYRLPTEIEWEYAAKMGMEATAINWQDTTNLEKYAIYSKNSGNKYSKVGQLKPNGLGIYDMHGNVAEWTLDQYDERYYEKLIDGVKDPVSPRTKRYPSTVKGGHYASNAMELRPNNRIPSELIWNRRDPQIPKSKWWNADSPFVGFRIVRPMKQPTKIEIEKFFETYLK